MTRVFIVAETRVFRDGLVQTLRHEQIDVVGAASAGDDAVDRVRSLKPDIVILDMARMESAETLRELTGARPTLKIVAVGVPEIERHVIACAEAGISGYVQREGDVADLVATLKSVANGEALFSPRMAASLLRRIAVLAAEREPDVETRLTPRETEIAELLADGLSNKEIAQRLCVEVATVKNHVHSILDKLKVSRRGEAAARVRRGVRRARAATEAVVDVGLDHGLDPI
jgi:DNA-binding NarL/FixJ family response regulator